MKGVFDNWLVTHKIDKVDDVVTMVTRFLQDRYPQYLIDPKVKNGCERFLHERFKIPNAPKARYETECNPDPVSAHVWSMSLQEASYIPLGAPIPTQSHMQSDTPSANQDGFDVNKFRQWFRDSHQVMPTNDQMLAEMVDGFINTLYQNRIGDEGFRNTIRQGLVAYWRSQLLYDLTDADKQSFREWLRTLPNAERMGKKAKVELYLFNYHPGHHQDMTYVNAFLQYYNETLAADEAAAKKAAEDKAAQEQRDKKAQEDKAAQEQRDKKAQEDRPQVAQGGIDAGANGVQGDGGDLVAAAIRDRLRAPHPAQQNPNYDYSVRRHQTH
jgi:hypothetical protein